MGVHIITKNYKLVKTYLRPACKNDTRPSKIDPFLLSKFGNAILRFVLPIETAIFRIKFGALFVNELIIF
jgi:hypothetical protein